MAALNAQLSEARAAAAAAVAQVAEQRGRADSATARAAAAEQAAAAADTRAGAAEQQARVAVQAVLSASQPPVTAAAEEVAAAGAPAVTAETAAAAVASAPDGGAAGEAGLKRVAELEARVAELAVELEREREMNEGVLQELQQVCVFCLCWGWGEHCENRGVLVACSGVGKAAQSLGSASDPKPCDEVHGPGGLHSSQHNP